MAKTTIKMRFGAIPNELLNDEKISFKAKGIYGYIQSKPDGWEFSIAGIESQSNEGRASIAAGLKELEDAGWLERVALRTDHGFAGYDYILNSTAKRVSRFSASTKPDSTKRAITKLATSKQDISKQDISITNSKEIGEIIKAMENIDIKNKLNYSRKVQRDACTFLIKNYGFEKTLEMIAAIQAVKNKIPYMPSITTPVELRDKWVKVVDAVERVKLSTQQKREVL